MGADADRATEFVGGNRHCLRPNGKIKRQFAGGLRGVDVQRDFARIANIGEFGDRLDHASFVVGEHCCGNAGDRSRCNARGSTNEMTPLASTAMRLTRDEHVWHP